MSPGTCEWGAAGPGASGRVAWPLRRRAPTAVRRLTLEDGAAAPSPAGGGGQRRGCQGGANVVGKAQAPARSPPRPLRVAAHLYLGPGSLAAPGMPSGNSWMSCPP